MPNNLEFLQALFQDDAAFVHVTDFSFDPNSIPSDQHLIAWRGDWFSRYPMKQGTNQYFTISIFSPDDRGIARRRKALFLRTRVIVLDDVKEKLSLEAVNKLPLPSWVLETSPGSEQWGYILEEPCADRGQVENLLDGLVANGLAPDGRDPGMKGVTRYVRLPDGYNLKASKFVNGLPFKCRMVEWYPERKTTMQALADPFSVDLNRVRRESRVDGAASVPDHPLLQIPDIIRIKEVRSDGRFDITCPWVDEHTNAEDSGSGIFTNDDGSIGFKCHHGACQNRTARDLIQHVESVSPGFGERLSSWRVSRVFSDMVTPSFINGEITPTIKAEHSTPVSFLKPVSFLNQVAPPPPSINTVLDQLKRERHTTPEARSMAERILRIAHDLPPMERQQVHDEVCDLMHWSQTNFKKILKELQQGWFSSGSRDASFLSSIIYIQEQDRFYDYDTRIFYTPAAFQNSFSDKDDRAKDSALIDGNVEKVHKMDFAPRQPRVFTRRGIVYGNSWCASHVSLGEPGDCSRWLAHWDHIGWTEHRKHHLQWMAYTLKFPETKINHMLVFGGVEGTGKDFLLYPLIAAFGDYANTIEGAELTSPHNEYLLSTKLLVINETELGDHNMAREISNKLKPLAAAPPMTLRVNPKGITAINITNLISGVMTTNSKIPVKLTGVSRRFYATWSRLNVRDENDNMIPEWKTYWEDIWKWMQDGGFESCIHYLMNSVDLTGFNPGAAPPMTDFLREIRESSKPPAQVTIENFIKNRVGAFRAELATSSELCATLRAADMTHGDLLNIESSWFTPVRVGRILGEITGCMQFKAAGNNESIRVWALRNQQRYIALGVGEVYRLYDEGMKAVKSGIVREKAHIRAVK